MTTGTGACGCGEISFHFEMDAVSVINCHCNSCRSHNGAAFTTYVIVQADDFGIGDPTHRLTAYKEEGSTKYFCSKCGTPIFNALDAYPAIRLVYLGTIEQQSQLQPAINVWCENQLDWVNALDKIKSVDQAAS